MVNQAELLWQIKRNFCGESKTLFIRQFCTEKIPFRTWSSPKICTANSHNAARWLPAGRCGRLCAMAVLAPAGCHRDLCGNNFSDGTLATSTVRFWWFRKVLIFRLLQRLKNRGVEVVGVWTSTAGSHNAARWLPAGRSGGLCSMALLAPAGCYRGLCGNNFSDGTLATSTVRFAMG